MTWTRYSWCCDTYMWYTKKRKTSDQETKYWEWGGEIRDLSSPVSVMQKLTTCQINVCLCQCETSSADADTCEQLLLTLCCPPSPPGCTEEVPDGAQEQRGEFGEVPGRAKETAPEEPGQQAPVQIWGQGDAGQCVSVCVGQCKCVQLLQWINKEKSRCLWITSIRMAICRTSFRKCMAAWLQMPVPKKCDPAGFRPACGADNLPVSFWWKCLFHIIHSIFISAVSKFETPTETFSELVLTFQSTTHSAPPGSQMLSLLLMGFEPQCA